MSDAADAAPIYVRIAIEPTHADQFGLRPRSEQAFAGLIEPVSARFPIADQPVQKQKALVERLGSKCTNLGMNCGYRLDSQQVIPRLKLTGRFPRKPKAGTMVPNSVHHLRAGITSI